MARRAWRGLRRDRCRLGAAFARGDGRAARAWARAARPSTFLDGHDAAADRSAGDGSRAVATMRSRPAALAIRRLTENDPLGGRVMRAPRKTTTPFRLITTFQRRPLRFWSTSNSVSTRPSSCFALSFQFAPRARADARPHHAGVVPGRGDGGKRHADRQKRYDDYELAHFLPPWINEEDASSVLSKLGQGLG